MADLSEINSAQAIKIVGSNSTGVESNAVDAPTTEPTLADPGLAVRPIPYEPITYSASVSALITATAPTDIFNIIGSSTKIIRITNIRLTGTTTAGSPISVSASLIKRSTANTGGNRTPATNVPNDSAKPAGTANVGSYTINPTALGTTVGNVRSHRITFNQDGVTGGDIVWDFPIPLVLRGTSEQLAINFNSTTVTGSIISINISWQEV